LIGDYVIYFIFCLAVGPPWRLPFVHGTRVQPWFLTARLSEGAPSVLRKFASSWGMFTRCLIACRERLRRQHGHDWF